MKHSAASYLDFMKGKKSTESSNIFHKSTKSSLPYAAFKPSYAQYQPAPIKPGLIKPSHRKSVSTAQGSSGREKVAKVLANLTAKYSAGPNNAIPKKKEVPHTSKGTTFTMLESDADSSTFDNRTRKPAKNYSVGPNSKYHKRTKSDYIFTAAKRRPSPAPTPTPGKFVAPKQPVIGSFKVIPNGPSLPDVNKVPSSEESIDQTGGNNKTTITNNTNIIVIGGHTCKINTLASSPPELVQYNNARPVLRTGCKSVTKKTGGVSPEKMVPAGIRQKYFSMGKTPDEASVFNKNSKSHSIITHKRSISDSHGSSLRKSNVDQQYILKYGARKATVNGPVVWSKNGGKIDPRKISTATSVSGSNPPSVISSIVTKPPFMTDQHTQENSVELAYPLDRKHGSGGILRTTDTKKTSELFHQPLFINSVDLLEKADISLSLKRIIHTITAYIDDQSKAKMDPRREKEMLELSEYIKKVWKETRKPPQTTVAFYKIGKVLGKGAFGKVNLGIHKLSGKFVAIKSIQKQVMKDETSKNKVLREVSIWEQLSHPSIIRNRLYETFESEKHLLYVEELCAGGDLLTYVRKRRRLKEVVAKFILKQILDGLYYCHSKNILHRDIKLDNILLNGEGDIKICDFGVSKVVRPGERITEQCGTPAYIAPEILKDKGYEGFAVDIWSAGVVLYAMVYGTVPFRAGNMAELHKLIMKGNYTLKEDVSEEVRDLLGKMLEVDPRRRYTIPQILCHKWFANFDPNISLFTKEEKENIAKEFTYSKRANRNQTIEGATSTIESDWFIEQNIDLTQCELTKNITSKSVILAPFNSTVTDSEKSAAVIPEVIYNKRVIKLSAKVREVDRQYEKNNNCEVDNGVYNKCAYEPSEHGKRDLEDLDPLANNEGSFEDNSPPPEIRGCAPSRVEIRKKDVLHREAVQAYLLNSLAPRPLIIDKAAVDRVVELGYPRDYTMTALDKSWHNHATTTYFLLLSQQ